MAITECFYISQGLHSCRNTYYMANNFPLDITIINYNWILRVIRRYYISRIELGSTRISTRSCYTFQITVGWESNNITSCILGIICVRFPMSNIICGVCRSRHHTSFVVIIICQSIIIVCCYFFIRTNSNTLFGKTICILFIFLRIILKFLYQFIWHIIIICIRKFIHICATTRVGVYNSGGH